MTKGVFNWTFNEVVKFLKSRDFHHIETVGSHYHYTAVIGGIARLVQVPFHGQSAIKPRTFKSIVIQSGLPMKEWRG
jgi:predicted RNA binding protein YcfA (HicA-like mRNA interferase family)